MPLPGDSVAIMFLTMIRRAQTCRDGSFSSFKYVCVGVGVGVCACVGVVVCVGVCDSTWKRSCVKGPDSLTMCALVSALNDGKFLTALALQ